MPYDPPEPPACKPEEADLFDNEWLYDQALAICAPCPVKAWCLRQVDPVPGFYDGVAGGHVWKDGQVVHKWTDTQEPIVQVYLASRRGTKVRSNDNQKILQLIIGNLHWTRTTFAERVAAAVEMSSGGYEPKRAMKTTGLSPDQIIDIYTNPTKYKNG